MRNLLLVLGVWGCNCLFAATLYCHTCGKAIEGQYISYHSQAYCSQRCLEPALPTCEACHCTIHDKSFNFNGHIVCSEQCAKVFAPHCATCGQPILGAYTEATSIYGKRYICPTCRKLSRCFICQMPATRAIDSRHFICDCCHETEVADDRQARALFAQIRQEVEALLGKPTTCDLQFKLVSFSELATLSQSAITKADDVQELGLFVRERLQSKSMRTGKETTRDVGCTIYVLRHLPLETFRDVVAHELAHNWMSHHMPQTKALVDIEGFAEYVAACIDRAHGAWTIVQMKEDNKDPIYGNGYRLWKKRIFKQKQQATSL